MVLRGKIDKNIIQVFFSIRKKKLQVNLPKIAFFSICASIQYDEHETLIYRSNGSIKIDNYGVGFAHYLNLFPQEIPQLSIINYPLSIRTTVR